MPPNNCIAAKMEYAPHNAGRGRRLISLIQHLTSSSLQYAARQLAVADISRRAGTLLATITVP